MYMTISKEQYNSLPEKLREYFTNTNFHPTVKSKALCEYLIKMITPKGGIVLDPFAGSGSTLVAAKDNGFKYVGIEITEEYLPIIEARTGCEIIKQDISLEETKQVFKKEEMPNAVKVCETIQIKQNKCPSCGGRLIKTKLGLTCEDCLEDY